MKANQSNRDRSKEKMVRRERRPEIERGGAPETEGGSRIAVHIC